MKIPYLEGYGYLTDGVSCKVTEELNTSFELTLDYPVTGVHYDGLQVGNIIVTRTNTHNDKTQPFRIYRITKPLNGVVTVYAAHISYDLAGYVTDMTNTEHEHEAAEVSTIIEFLQAAADDYVLKVGGVSFKFSTTGEFEAAPWSVSSYTDLRVIMQTAAKQYNGQWEYDGYNCILRLPRGQNRGVSIEYGKNLIDISEEIDISETYTHIMPFYKTIDDTTEERQEIVVGGLDAVVSTGTSINNYTRTQTLDLSNEFAEIPTVEQIQERAAEYAAITEIGKIVISRDISAVDRGKTLEYPELTDDCIIELGDTVRVYVPILGINAAMNCMQIVYDAYLDIVDSYEIGHIKKSYIANVAEKEDEEDEKDKDIYDNFDDIYDNFDNIYDKLDDIDDEIEDIEEEIHERAPTLFIQIDEPEDSEEDPLVNGDYWLELNSEKSAVAFYKYSSGWSLQCNFMNRPKVIISKERPDPAGKQYDIWVKGTDAENLSDVDYTSITDIYEFSGTEDDATLRWRSIPFTYNEQYDRSLEVGDYSIYYNSAGKVTRLRICVTVDKDEHSVTATWANVYPTDETGRDSKIYARADEPVTPGTYWIQLSKREVRAAIAVYKYDVSDDKYDWILQYTIGEVVPSWFVQADAPFDAQANTLDYWLKTNSAESKTIQAMYQCRLKQEDEEEIPDTSIVRPGDDEMYQWDLLGYLAPNLYTQVTNPLTVTGNKVRVGDYWLQIKDTTSKELVAFYVAKTANDTLYFDMLYAAPSGGGGSGLSVTINYALVVDKEGVLSG